MTFPVVVELQDGHFAAALVGAPTIRAVGATRAEALAALHADLAQRLARGELVSLEVTLIGVSGLAGTYRTDPTLQDIYLEAYRQHEADSQA